jgi:hypothetical protein
MSIECTMDRRSIWLSRFADRLGRLQPGLDRDAYVRIAEWNYPDAVDLPPEHAAALYAVDRPVKRTSQSGNWWAWPSPSSQR